MGLYKPIIIQDSSVDISNLATKSDPTTLQTMYDAMNHGQQKKIVKDEKVKALFDRYGVEYTE